MMASLVTQLVDDIPTVLVMYTPETNALALESEAWLQAHGLGVRLQDISSGLPSSEFYRIVVFLDLVSVNFKEIEPFIKALQIRKEPLSLVCKVITPIDASHNLTEPWVKSSLRQHRNLIELETLFPQAQKIILLDVIDTNSHNVLSFMAATQENPSFLAPLIDIAPQLPSDAINAFLPELIKPFSPFRLVVEAESISAKNVAEKIAYTYQQYYHQSLPIETISVFTLNLPEGTQRISGYISSFQPEKWLRNNPLFKAQKQPKNTKKNETFIAQKYQTVSKIEEPVEITQPQVAQVKPRAASRITTVSPDVVSSYIPPAQPEIVAAVPKRVSHDPEKNMEQAVLSLFSTIRTQDKTTSLSSSTKQRVKMMSKLKRRKRVFVGGLFLGTVSCLLVAWGGLVLGTGYVTNQTTAQILETGTPPAPWRVVAAHLFFTQKNLVNNYLHLGEFSEKDIAAQAIIKTAPLLLTQYQTWQTQVHLLVANVMGQNQVGPVPDLDELLAQSESLYSGLSELQAAAKSLTTQSTSTLEELSPLSTVNQLQAERTALGTFNQIAPHLTTLLGKSGKRTIAVVFQNNQELRATGGFVQSVLLLTLDQGQIISTQALSADQIDRQIVGEVKPPADLEKTLGEKKWFFRDSNWQPDLTQTGPQMEWFIEQATNRPIDGLVLITPESLAKLIKATGPVEFPEYNEVITDKNIFERLEFHSEIQLVPGATADYSTQLIDRVWHKLSTLSPDKYSQVLSELHQALNTQEISVFIEEPAIAQFFQDQGWAGNLIEPSCPPQLFQENCQIDYLAQVESNVGINKANYYLKTNLDHQVKIEDQIITHDRTITWENTSQSNAWPKGTYKNYVRFYLPATSTQVNLIQEGKPITPLLDQIIDGKRVIGVVLEIPVQTTQTMLLHYQVPRQFPTGHFTYALFDQKQAGSQVNKQITVAYPAQLQPQVIAPQADVKKQSIVFERQSSTHAFVGVSF